MLVLALDTSTPAVTAGLVRHGGTAAPVVPVAGSGPGSGAALGGLEVLAERVVVDGRRHGELLAPLVQECLVAAGVTPADLGAVVVGTGPGPFTGLRVGMVTAAAIGDALEVPVHGVCSLDGIAVALTARGPAAAATDPAAGGPAAGSPAAAAGTAAGDRPATGGRHRALDLVVATDARRREVYWAGYRGPARVAGPFVDRPAALAARLPEAGQEAARTGHPGWWPRAAYGAGADLYAEVLGLPVPRAGVGLTAAALVACASDRLAGAAPGQPLTPLYLRRPDAVEPPARTAALR